MPVVEREEVRFTEYPEILDDYFKTTIITVRVVPTDLIQGIDKRCMDFEITSAREYFDYLNQEIDFWTINDSLNKFKSFSGIDNLKNALDSFNRAASYARDPNRKHYVVDELRKSFSYIAGKCLYSKTTIAKYLIDKCKDKSEKYVNGFKMGLYENRTQNAPVTIDGSEGFYAALIFLKSYKEVVRFSQNELLNLQQNINDANKNYTELNSRYTNSFRYHEEMIQSLRKQTQDNIDEMNQSSDDFFKECETRRNELEVLYNEKLKFEEPAKYWQEMEEEYRDKATFWVIMSSVVAFVTMVGLVVVLALLPNLFSRDSHWIDVFKNSAIITFFLSIAVYVLRLFVKLATSSFHLSRDAKERNKLAYFYLALIAKGAVDEKERSIILNALFSRADTGLLKGDSSPAMPTNVTEIIKKLND